MSTFRLNNLNSTFFVVGGKYNGNEIN